MQQLPCAHLLALSERGMQEPQRRKIFPLRTPAERRQCNTRQRQCIPHPKQGRQSKSSEKERSKGEESRKEAPEGNGIAVGPVRQHSCIRPASGDGNPTAEASVKADGNVTTQNNPDGAPETPNQGIVNFDKWVPTHPDYDDSPIACKKATRQARSQPTTEQIANRPQQQFDRRLHAAPENATDEDNT